MVFTDFIRTLDELSSVWETCNRCGMCQAVCPLFRVTGLEKDVARGKIVLLKGLRQEILKNPHAVLERINRCLLCNACGRTCSRKLDLSDIFIKTRVLIVSYIGLPFYKKILFRVVLAYPEIFEKLTGIYSKTAQLIPEKFKKKGMEILPVFFPALSKRTVPDVSGSSFRSISKKIYQEVRESSCNTSSVIFFSGCIIDKVLIDTGVSCVRVLNKLGISVKFIDNEACCGIPALASGDRRGFEKMLNHNLDMLMRHGGEPIVTACATCYMSISRLWPEMARSGHFLSDRVKNSSNRVLEITGFILSHTDVFKLISCASACKSKKSITTVAYHEPCHLKNHVEKLKVVELLKSLPGYRYVETRNQDSCCGMGGSFGIAYADLSKQIGEKRARDIADSGADVVVTACPACMIQLKEMLAGIKKDIRVMHIAEVLDDVLNLQ